MTMDVAMTDIVACILYYPHIIHFHITMGHGLFWYYEVGDVEVVRRGLLRHCQQGRYLSRRFVQQVLPLEVWFWMEV